MNKIALTSLLAVFTASSAMAANVIDGNPLYLPKAGHFYSVSALASHSGDEDLKAWTIGEEFGYGVTDKFAIALSTDINDERSFDQWSWGELKLDAKYRVLDMGAWKADLVGAYAVSPVWANHTPFMKAGTIAEGTGTEYTWTAGVRGGYVASSWTLAGHAMFNYWNTESFNWSEKAGERGVHTLALGIDGQYVFCPRWSMLAGVEYTGVLDSQYRDNPDPAAKVKNAGLWTAELGLNYNIDATKFVGAFINADMNHRGGTNADEWKVENGFGFGAKFGIDF